MISTDILKLLSSVLLIAILIMFVIHISLKYPSSCSSCWDLDKMSNLDYSSVPEKYDYTYDDYWAWKQVENFESGYIPYISKGIYDDYLY